MECFSICQPVLNPGGFCPGSCFSKCPDLCRVLLVDDAHLYPYVPPRSLPPPPPPPPPPPINRQHVISTSMAIGASLLGTVLFLGVFCIVSRSYCRRQGNQRRRAGIGPTREDFWGENNGFELDHPFWYIHTVGLEQSVIDSITVFKYKKGEGGLVEGGTVCSVCLSDFRDDESLRLLPNCSHAFHPPCIDTWLRSHKNCPVCRAPIVKANFDGRVEMLVPLSGNLSSREEAQMGNSGSGSTSDGEVRLVDGYISASEDETNGGSKLNLHDSNSSDHIQVPSDFVEHGEDVEAAIQTVRRSVSLDSSSALAVYAAVSQAVRDKQRPGNLDGIKQSKHSRAKHLDKRVSTGSLSFRKLMMDSSIGRSLQPGPISMKRSSSSSGKSSSSSFALGESGRLDSV